MRRNLIGPKDHIALVRREHAQVDLMMALLNGMIRISIIRISMVQKMYYQMENMMITLR